MQTKKIVIFLLWILANVYNYVLFLHKTLMVRCWCIIYVIVTHVTDTHQCVMYNICYSYCHTSILNYSYWHFLSAKPRDGVQQLGMSFVIILWKKATFRLKNGSSRFSLSKCTHIVHKIYTMSVNQALIICKFEVGVMQVISKG